MALTNHVVHYPIINTPFNFKQRCSLFPILTNGSSHFTPKTHFSNYPSLKIKALSTSDSQTGEVIKQTNEIVYNKEGGVSRLSLFSPCKVNVFLRITRKREDGYHDLASLFHVISLGDNIEFSLLPSNSKDSLSSNVSGVPLDDRNLIIRALKLFREKTGFDEYFGIHLDKKVPTGAGLGGGSSNAATTLWAINQFSGGIATVKQLQEWSGEIGSDVPFFFSRGAAYCTGRGEVVEDIPSPIPLDTPIVLIKPPEACATAEVYKRFRLDKTTNIDPLTLLKKVSEEGISQDVCINDLECPAFEVLPSLQILKQRISTASRGQYNAVFMSGSGSTIVGVGSPHPPQFIYDEEEYKDVFLSEATFITREEDSWYAEPASNISADSIVDFSRLRSDQIPQTIH